jgi:hypothetical protein
MSDMKTLAKIMVDGQFQGLLREDGTVIVPAIYEKIIDINDGELYACTRSPVAQTSFIMLHLILLSK